jgi:hypothetical protein
MTDYAAILTVLYPDALWGMTDNDYGTLSWDESNSDAKPSQAVLDAAWPQVLYDRQYAQVEAAASRRIHHGRGPAVLQMAARHRHRTGMARRRPSRQGRPPLP